MTTFLVGINYLILYYFLVLNGIYLFLIALSSLEIRRNLRRLPYGGYDWIFSDPLTPPISVLVPARNEENGIVFTVKNLLHLRYPRYEVIVINDGSEDGTLKELIRAFWLVPFKKESPDLLPTQPVRSAYFSLAYSNLRVIDKEKGGKADALNAGINLSKYDYFLSIDADDILDEDSLLKVIRPVTEDPERVVAVGGIVRVVNGCRVEKGRVVEPALSSEVLAVLQTIEYLRAFMASRTGLSALNANLIISGAFGFFKKEIALKIGGYRRDTVGEDMAIVMDFHRNLCESGKDYRIVTIGEPICWTKVPSTLQALYRQRRRWQRGLLEVLPSYLKMIFNPRYGWVGTFSYPFFLFFEGWGVLVEVLGYLVFAVCFALGIVDQHFAAAFLAAAVLLGVTQSLAAIILEEVSYRRYPRWGDLFKLMLISFLENFGYRQLISLFRVHGIADFLRRKKGWGK